MQRFSKKRTAIYDCLCGTKTHPTADWIYQQLLPEFPDLSLATVYRNLAQLKEAGRIRSVGTVAGQERFDADLHPHGRRAEDASGWSVCGTSLRLTGLCPACRRTTS